MDGSKNDSFTPKDIAEIQQESQHYYGVSKTHNILEGKAM